MNRSVSNAFVATQTDPAKSSDVWFAPGVQPLPFWFSGGTVVMHDDRVISLQDGKLGILNGDGQTWQWHEIQNSTLPKDMRHSLLFECADGTLLFFFLDFEHLRLEWDDDTHVLKSKPRLDACVARSTDGGGTWSKPRIAYDGYCGALINVIQTESGRLVLPVQYMMQTPPRHVQTTCVSDDVGENWQQSNIIDLGGHGHHDGCIEAAVVKLRDGRLWMVMRSNLEQMWQAWSEDEGLSWRTIMPGPFDASSSPANLKRLASGRLLLAWNRLYPEGLTPRQQADWERAGGDMNICQPLSSWHRHELSVAISDDDGQTWTQPCVAARGRQVSYPHILERRPGEVWIATQFGPRVSFCLDEQEFLAANNRFAD